jgi:hypothetical protein
MIHVEAPVTAAPAQPTGPTEICGSFIFDYNSSAVPNATAYTWEVLPTSAGTISGTGITGTLNASNTWNGPFTVKMTGSNSCGAGPASPVLNVVSTHQPLVYSLFSGGGYCAGQPGYEIKLEDSETGVNYQLYKDGFASGSLVPGTGNMLSFGPQTVGTYTVTAVNGICTDDMQGASTNYVIDPPATATQPTGPASTCNNSPSTFTASLPANGYTLLWSLNPSTAGTIAQPTLTTAVVTWTPGFSGPVAVTVQGQNECGEGQASAAHTITVNAIPTPVTSGNTSVCKTQEITYSTIANSGSTYVWAVTGGTINSGQGSNQITVIWGNPGIGSVSVTETSAEGCTGTSQALSVTISECTSIAEIQTESITIYPNPAMDQLNIKLNTDFKVHEILIYNKIGQLISRQPNLNAAGETEITIDISSLTTGVYTLRLNGENLSLNKLFIRK